MMSKLFLDVLGNKELVDGYQIEDSIAQKYHLTPGSICPFTGLRVEILSPQQIHAAEKAARRRVIKPKRTGPVEEKQKLQSPLAQKQKKKNLSTAGTKISGVAAGLKATRKSIHPEASHDSARGRSRSIQTPTRRDRTFKKEEGRMATAKKVQAKPAKAAVKAPAKAKAAAKAPVKAAAKPTKAKAKAVAKAPAKAKASVKAKAVAKAPAKAKAKAKAPAKAKAVAKKPAKAKK